MNGRQARGWGMSAHERTKTTTKKAANSMVGKLTAAILATGAVAAPQAAAEVTCRRRQLGFRGGVGRFSTGYVP
jgi:hypothetical protein